MAKAKQRYFKKKKKLPQWNEYRQLNLVFRNKMKKYTSLSKKTAIESYTSDWHRFRRLSIPSSLIRKVVSGNPDFLLH